MCRLTHSIATHYSRRAIPDDNLLGAGSRDAGLGSPDFTLGVEAADADVDALGRLSMSFD